MAEAVIDKIRRLTKPVYYKFILIPRAKIKQYWCVKQIKKKRNARIVFLVSSLPMWRCQALFNRLQNDHRFDVSVAIYPFRSFNREEKESAIQRLRVFFSRQNIPLFDLSNETSPGHMLRRVVNPDLIFYPQPYNGLFGNDLDSQFFSDKLICFIPYGMPVVKSPWIDRNFLNNTAWRVFFHSEMRKRQAKEVLFNHGRNIRITGDPISDLFKEPVKESAWKTQKCEKKKIIWAPHYSFQKHDRLHLDSFIWLYEAMFKLAMTYRDSIQFSFKPHPKLLTSLYEIPEWGAEKADAYYNMWAEGDNTQLDTGQYIDLFKESDAMIHDSSSFTAEYLFTGKPALFTSKDINSVFEQMNEFGFNALSAHYICNSVAGITHFIEETVLGGNDPLKSTREAFYQKYLCPPKGHPVSVNIYNEIIDGLGFKS